MLDADDELAFLSERIGTAVLDEDALHEPVSVLCNRRAETILESATIADAIRRMKTSRIGSLAVVEESGLLVGIVTERDVLFKVMLEEVDIKEARVDSIMTRDPETLLLEDSMVFLMNKMHIGSFRHVPIVDASGRPLHVLSIKDVVSFVVSRFEHTVANVPPDSFAQHRRFVV
jgi:CBS domain-containing protein